MLITLILYSLTGCSGDVTLFNIFSYHGLRIGQNTEDHLKTARDTVTFDFKDSQQHPYSGEGADGGYIEITPDPITPSTNIYYKPHTGVSNPDDYAPLRVDTVCSRDYINYLKEYVVRPMEEILEEIPAELKSKLYFRVMHSGYEEGSSANKIKQGKTYDSGAIGKAGVIGGKTLPIFCCNWLNQTSINKTAVYVAYTNYMSKVSQANIDKSSDWLGVSDEKGISKDVIAMYGSVEVDEKTKWGSYLIRLNGMKDNPRKDCLGIIPNINYTIFTNAENKSYIQINPTSELSSIGSVGYKHNMKLANMRNVFTSYNQFSNRDSEVVDLTLDDSCSALRGYIDGYTKTIIFLGTEPDTDLSTVLGDKMTDAVNIITTAYSQRDWSSIQGLYIDKNITVLPAGSIGVD